LGVYDPVIKDIEIRHTEVRRGDVPHSLASVDKAQSLLGYQPTHRFDDGLKEAVDWYWKNLKPHTL